jgi:hypothetical protein
MCLKLCGIGKGGQHTNLGWMHNFQMEGVLSKCGKMCLKLCGICKGGQQTNLGWMHNFQLELW